MIIIIIIIIIIILTCCLESGTEWRLLWQLQMLSMTLHLLQTLEGETLFKEEN